MTRKCKCKACGKQLTTDIAYLYTYLTKTGKEIKQYYCSEEEFENLERDKKLYKECLYETDKILERPITNSIRNKELAELHEQYSWEEILRCIKSKSDEINMMIKQNGIENDYQQIRYMMQTIKNVIYDFVREDKQRNDWTQYNQSVEQEVEIEIIKEEVPSDMKVKKRKRLF